jgi:hypothetical protein
MKLRDMLLSAVMIVATLAASVYAQQPKATSVAGTLTWISSHFETTTSYVRVLSESQSTAETQSFSMSFQGCRVTVSMSRQYLHVAADGKTDTNYSGTVITQFELSNLQLDKIKMVTGSPETCFADGSTTDCPDKKGVPNPPQLIGLSLRAVTPIPTTDSVWGSSTTKGIWIRFSTQDLANQQAKAWSTAIIACGGK